MVMRASSCVSRSNLFSIFSISLSPNNFFANCSATHSEVVTYDYKTPHTESPSAYLFLCYCKYRNQLHHYLRDNIRHKWVQGDLGINMETIEEVSKVFEEFEEGIIARAYSISGLGSFEDQIDSAKEEGAHGEENIDPDEDEFSRLERYLVEKE